MAPNFITELNISGTYCNAVTAVIVSVCTLRCIRWEARQPIQFFRSMGHWVSAVLTPRGAMGHGILLREIFNPQVLLNRVPEQITETNEWNQNLLLKINFRVEITIFTQCDEVLRQ